MLVAHPRVADPNALGVHVDVTPEQPQQLGLAQTRRPRREQDQPYDRAARVLVDRPVGDHLDHAIELSRRQELQIRVRVARSPALRPGRVLDRVGRRPPLTARQPEHRVQERHHVAHRLRRRATGQHPARQPLDVLGRDRADLALAQHRRDVDALHRLDVLSVGLARALDRDPLPQPVGDLVDREDLDHRVDRLACGFLPLDAPESLLGLRASQPVRSASIADLVRFAVEVPPVSRAPAAVVATPLLVDAGRTPEDASYESIAVACRNWTPFWTPIGPRRPKTAHTRTGKGPALQGLSDIGETGRDRRRNAIGWLPCVFASVDPEGHAASPRISRSCAARPAWSCASRILRRARALSGWP